MKRMRIFTGKISSANKENPSWELPDPFVKLKNGLNKSRLMVVAFVLGNLLMTSTGLAQNVTISTGKTANGTWTGSKAGPYSFSPSTGNANIDENDIVVRLNGTQGYTASSVTINSGASGNVTISAAIAGTNTSPTLTITASGSISSTAAISAGNIVLTGATGISISANLTASGTITINDGAATVTIGGINDGQKATSIISGGSFVKQGAGTFLLAGQSTFTALTISSGNLTIPAGGRVTVTGATTITPANGLTIESTSEISGAGTGSFITGSATGSATVKRYMAPRKWHIVSSPLSGQTVGGFLGTNPNIPTNTVANHTTERGMRGYDPSANQWTNFYTNTTGGNIETGKGFLVRVKGSTSAKEVIFTGTLQAGNQSATGLTSGKWNCIGNPYTSALKLNSTGSTDNFLDVNATNLDMTFGGIYIWKQSNEVLDDAQATGAYEPVTNASSLYEIQQGQAFMVKMADALTATSVSFTNAMQSHNTGLELKSTSGIWPTIKLTATADSITSSTIIAFHEGMTPGLDPTYDAGLLKGGAPVEVYTRLVEDNGIPFDIQALPANYESIVVPVGIDCTKGQQVTFSAQLLHVPSACQVLLEDRLNKVLTDLSVNSYTADLMGSTVSQDRFFLHTSYSTTGIDSRDRIQDLRAWAVSNREMKISGKVSSGAIASLYDLQGRAVAISTLREGNLNSVPLKGLKQGVYMLRVQDNTRVQVQKVMISQ